MVEGVFFCGAAALARPLTLSPSFEFHYVFFYKYILPPLLLRAQITSPTLAEVNVPSVAELPLQARARMTNSVRGSRAQHIRCASTHRYRGPYVVTWLFGFLFANGGVVVVTGG